MKILKMITLSTFFISQSIYACSCMQWGSAKEMLMSFDAAFLAIPSEASQTIGRDEDWGEDLMETKFSVVKSFKGKKLSTVALRSIRDSGANCGLDFQKDDRLWLIFATKEEDGTYSANSCTISGLYSTEDRAFLRELNSL